MKRVLLISFFNSSNIGDRAICRVMEEKLSAVASIEKMDITGKEIQLPALTAKGLHIGEAGHKCRFYTLKSVLALRKPGRLNYAKSCIDRCDAIIIAGGNMIMEPEKFSFYSFLTRKYVMWAKKRGKKVAILFVGVGNNTTQTQRRQWHNALENSNMISVRDTISREKMYDDLRVKKDVLVWKDPVFWLETSKEYAVHKSVAVNIYLAAVKPEEKEDLKRFYLYLIEELQKETNVVLYATEQMDIGGLYEIYDALETKDRVTLCSPDSMEQLIGMYHTVDAAVATRMHAFIIAITQAVPTLVLSWNAKIDGVAADVGLSDFVVDIKDSFAKRKYIMAQIDAFRKQPEKYAEQLYVVNRKNRKELDDVLETIRVFLEGEKCSHPLH